MGREEIVEKMTENFHFSVYIAHLFCMLSALSIGALSILIIVVKLIITVAYCVFLCGSVVKNLLAMQETWVGKIPWRRE